MRIEVVLVGKVAVVWFCWTIQADHITITDVLESVIDKRRNHNQLWLGAFADNLVNFSFGRRAGTIVIQRETRAPLNQAEMIGLQSVQMPAFDDTRFRSRDVQLAEPLAFRLV